MQFLNILLHQTKAPGRCNMWARMARGGDAEGTWVGGAVSDSGAARSGRVWRVEPSRRGRLYFQVALAPPRAPRNIPLSTQRRHSSQAGISPTGRPTEMPPSSGKYCHRRVTRTRSTVHSSPERVKETYGSTTDSDNLTYIYEPFPCPDRRGGARTGQSDDRLTILQL
jgi:hypothetical protein